MLNLSPNYSSIDEAFKVYPLKNNQIVDISSVNYNHKITNCDEILSHIFYCKTCYSKIFEHVSTNNVTQKNIIEKFGYGDNGQSKNNFILLVLLILLFYIIVFKPKI